jgi:hypothetical protein
MPDQAMPVVYTLPPLRPPMRAASAFATTVLPRHGRRPLGFQGRLLVQAASRAPGLPVWSEIAVHETDAGTLVGAIRHIARAAPQTALHYAEAAPTPRALLGWLHAHDPVADLPAEILLGPARDLRAAPAIAAALRDAWRGLLVVTFDADAVVA